MIRAAGSGSSARFGAADRFLLMVDRELRRRRLHGFQAVLAIELGGDLDGERRKRLAAAFRDLIAAEPRGRARLARRLGFGPLALAPRADAEIAEPRERTCAAPDLLAFARERFLAPLDPTRDPLIDLELEGARGSTRLVLRWWHPIMDERGAELLLRELARRESAASGTAAPGAATPGTVAPAMAARVGAEGDAIRGWLARWKAFRNARKRLAELTKRPPFLLAPPASGVAPSGSDWEAEVELLAPDVTTRFLAACDAEYGVRGEGLAQIGLLFAALADLAPQAAPHADDVELALPVSVQLRPPRARGPRFSNALSFLWYALPASIARDRARRAEALRALARAKVAGGEERETGVLLEFARCMPLPLYRSELVRNDGVSRFSAGLSTLGELFGGARELFGLPIRDALALTAFPAPPGLGVLFSRANGALRIVTLHAPSLIDRTLARRLHERIVARARELATLSAA